MRGIDVEFWEGLRRRTQDEIIQAKLSQRDENRDLGGQELYCDSCICSVASLLSQWQHPAGRSKAPVLLRLKRWAWLSPNRFLNDWRGSLSLRFQVLRYLVVFLVGAFLASVAVIAAYDNRMPLIFAKNYLKTIIWPIERDEFEKRQVAVRDQTAQKRKTISTNGLPLVARFFDTTEAGFPAIGGDISVDEGKVFLLGRLGRFYYFDGAIIVPTNLRVPNNLEQFIEDFGGNLGTNGLRAHRLIVICSENRVFASFQRYMGLGRTSLVLAWTEFDCQNPLNQKTAAWRDLYASELLGPTSLNGSHAAGGAIAKDETHLYLSIGWSASDESIQALHAQRADTHRGKVLRIDIESSHIEIFTLGHRNIQSMAVLGSGELVGVEHGPQGGDELNVLRIGENFGWPHRTFGNIYGTFDRASHRDGENGAGGAPESFSDPLYSFVPSVAPAAVLELSEFHERFEKDLLVGSLKTQSLYRMTYRNGRILLSEPIWIGHRIRGMAQEGRQLYLLTDDSYVVEVNVDWERLDLNITSNDLYFMSEVLKPCLTCHSMDETTPASAAPSLRNVFGRKIADDTFTRYSDGLKSIEGIWNEETLADFLSDPQRFASGTAMPKLDLSADDVAVVIEELKAYSN